MPPPSERAHHEATGVAGVAASMGSAGTRRSRVRAGGGAAGGGVHPWRARTSRAGCMAPRARAMQHDAAAPCRLCLPAGAHLSGMGVRRMRSQVPTQPSKKVRFSSSLQPGQPPGGTAGRMERCTHSWAVQGPTALRAALHTGRRSSHIHTHHRVRWEECTRARSCRCPKQRGRPAQGRSPPHRMRCASRSGAVATSCDRTARAKEGRCEAARSSLASSSVSTPCTQAVQG